MQAASNRTFICSIVFLDIVEYSKKPVAEQIVFKERLNNLLTEALADVAVNDRIILDTGDGAALSFLGDPEDALFVSLSLRDALAAGQPLGPQMKMRIGINLGPVKLVKDINGQPNIIGDGINVAQRVMSFSEPGQVLVSRSYYEVVSRMSEEYAPLFHYEGSRTDKHVREHEVYAVQSTGAPFRRSAAKRISPPSSHGGPMFDKLAQSASFVTGNLRNRPRLGTALAVIAILVVAVGLRVQRQPAAQVAAPSSPPEKTAAAPAPEPARPAAKPAVEAPPPAPPRKEPAAKPAVKPPAAPAAAAKSPAVKESPAAPAIQQPPATAARSPASKEPPAATEGRPPAAGGSGKMLLTVTPWGEIYIDGRHLGTTPQVYEVPLSSGRHRLEIRHPDFPPHVRNVDIPPGGRVEIKHWFQPKEQPNPIDSLRKLWK